MKLATTLLVLMVATVTVTSAQTANPLPENFVERVEAILKWFDLRISVYRKANMLLKQLIRKVNALQPYNSGMDIYYRKWIDFNGVPLLLRSVPVNATRTTPVSELLRKSLEQKDLRIVLSMMPEVQAAFQKLV